MLRYSILSAISCLFFSLTALAQQDSDEVINAYIKYTELPREVVSAHLNKTVFFKGEEIAFQAYVFEKGSHLLSKETTNLYCKLTDSEDNIIEQKLLKVENGFANGSFLINENLKKGEYQFTAYTNWMRNFSEKNHYEQQIIILDSTDPLTKNAQSEPIIDAQFLPEGGHAIAGVENVYGLIIRDQNGAGIKNVQGSILDINNTEITKFSSDEFGIGRFLFTPIHGENYFAVFKIYDTPYRIAIKDIEPYGINMQLTDMQSQVGIIFNKAGNIDDSYQLVIHNGKNLKAIDLNFSKSQKQIKVFKKEDLNPGINIFTLFDLNGNPLLERLYFNFQDIQTFALTKQIKTEKLEDSIKVTIPVPNIDIAQAHRFSISVLPVHTKAYNSSHNIASYLHLYPYVRGSIQNARYYFEDNDRKKRFQFDNLLLTQGWSSYNWYNIVNKPPKHHFDFEKGITITGTKNKAEDVEIFLSPLENSGLVSFAMDKKTKSFQKEFLFPYQDEKLRFSQITNKDNFTKVPLYVTFKPSAFPSYKTQSLLNIQSSQDAIENTDIENFSGLEQITALDEVVIEADRWKERVDNLKRTSYGTILAFSKNDYRRSLNLGNYLRSNGFRVTERDGLFSIETFRGGTPLIYLNDLLLTDLSILNNFSMKSIDYIEIDRTARGTTFGVSSNGSIRIYTDSRLGVPDNSETIFNEIEIPLAFSREKRFYNPKYNNYSDLSYQFYGAIDWHANLKVDQTGNIVFLIPNLGQDEVRLFVEGVANGNQLVSEALREKL